MEKRYWSHLREILATPRPSTDYDGIRIESRLDKIRAYIESVAKGHSWFYHADSAGNVVIRSNKPGPAVICMQGHLDVVVSADEPHDFENQGIQVVFKDDWVIPTTKTTLGADNGVALACAIAAMEELGKTVCLEALFTVDEETTFRGALEVDPQYITSSRLLNLDSEQDGEICVGCAGGFERTLIIPIPSSEPKVSSHLKVKVTGLRGGHSGIDIDRGRLNAIQVIAKLLEQSQAHVVSIEGGDAPNVIPREAWVVLVTPDQIAERAMLQSVWVACLATADEPAAKLTIEIANSVPMTNFKASEVAKNLLKLPHGVINRNYLGEVQTSINLSSVRLDPSRGLITHFFARSSSLTELKAVSSDLERLGVASEELNAFPGWEPQADSAFTKLVSSAYPGSHPPRQYTVHAGLECGALLARVPMFTDCASIGPTILGAHSPAEKLSISSSKNFVRWVEAIIRHLA